MWRVVSWNMGDDSDRVADRVSRKRSWPGPTGRPDSGRARDRSSGRPDSGPDRCRACRSAGAPALPAAYGRAGPGPDWDWANGAAGRRGLDLGSSLSPLFPNPSVFQINRRRAQPFLAPALIWHARGRNVRDSGDPVRRPGPPACLIPRKTPHIAIGLAASRLARIVTARSHRLPHRRPPDAPPRGSLLSENQGPEAAVPVIGVRACQADMTRLRQEQVAIVRRRGFPAVHRLDDGLSAGGKIFGRITHDAISIHAAGEIPVAQL